MTTALVAPSNEVAAYWKGARRQLSGLPDGGLNIAFEAVDRHAVTLGSTIALRFRRKDGSVDDYTYARLAKESNRQREDHAAPAEGARARVARRRHLDGEVRMSEHDLGLLRDMLRIRVMEEKCAELYSEEKIRGFLNRRPGRSTSRTFSRGRAGSATTRGAWSRWPRASEA